MIAAIIVTTALIIFFTTYLVMLTKKKRADKAFTGVGKLISKKNMILHQLVSRLKKENMKIETKGFDDVDSLLLEIQSNALKTEDKINLEFSIKKSVNPVINSVSGKIDEEKDPSLHRLIHSWKESEDRVSDAMYSFNKKASDFNNVIAIFPASLIANTRKGYQKKELIDITA